MKHHIRFSTTSLPLMALALAGFMCGIPATGFAQDPTNAPTTQGTPTTQESEKSPGSASPAATAPEPEIPIARQPYIVRVEIGFSSPNLLSASFRRDVLERLSDAIERVYGRMWTVSLVQSDWMYPGSISSLERVTAAQLTERFPTADNHKVMLVSFTESQGEWTTGVREFDCRVQDLTPVRTTRSADIRSLGSDAAQLMRDSFRPVLFLSQALKDIEELQFFLQAGTIPPRDPAAAQIATGDVLRPFLRHMDRKNPKQVRLLQKLELTYIRVTSFNTPYESNGVAEPDQDVSFPGVDGSLPTTYVDNSRVNGVLISHGMAPFGGRGRGVQQIALRQRPMASESRVRLVLSSRTDRPLVAHRIDLVPKLRSRDENAGDPVRHVSDRNGEVILKTDPKNPTFWLYVYSGGMLLARVPYAPGLMPNDTVKLPDDSLRLGVEGELYLFRDELVDMVARRAVFKGMARKAATTGDTEQLEAALKKIEGLKAKKEFDSDLNTVRVPAVDKAKALRNRSAERNIEKLCKAMSESLAEFFKTEKQLKEMDEIEKLRALAEDRKQNPQNIPPQTPSNGPQPTQQ